MSKRMYVLVCLELRMQPLWFGWKRCKLNGWGPLKPISTCLRCRLVWLQRCGVRPSPEGGHASAPSILSGSLQGFAGTCQGQPAIGHDFAKGRSVRKDMQMHTGSGVWAFCLQKVGHSSSQTGCATVGMCQEGCMVWQVCLTQLETGEEG